MKVYAQPTEWNERLCSLMSAVLQRSIRPSFTHAIRDKSQRMLSGGNTTTTHNSNSKSTVKILFVGRSLQTISSMTQAFGGLRYVLDVVSVVSSDNEQEIQKSLESFLCKGHNNKDPVVIVAVSSWADSLYQFLLRSMMRDGSSSLSTSNILGVISVLPTVHDLVPFLTVPLFVVLPSSHNQQQQYLSNYLVNPNAVVVQHDDDNTVDEDLLDLEDETTAHAVWVARTIAKYAEAVASISENTPTTTRHHQHFPLPTSRL